ncbi:cytotoxic translational repressor of toxin-antitoxin stability system [Actinocrispum sp. NPDC049592]|uniref:cytotoxic translational repressor of toxin-antitoxin stability system n=1 Tax=Actinocrispum sp. NPDC049592 TaxID=3154835 RepID=UPI00344695DF
MSDEPTPADHDRFCQAEGWTEVRGAGPRVTYELGLPDGRVLRTRISDRPAYGPDLWQHILHDELEVDQKAFWSCVKDGEKPDRGIPQARPDALPLDLVYLLIHRLGLPKSTIATLTRKEAITHLTTYWTQDPT